MAVYALGDRVPDIHPDAYDHPDAVVIGCVTLAAGASIWPGAVLRGDYGEIRIGERTSVQDGTIVHATEFDATVIGADCVVGHNAHLEGCDIGDRTLIGSMSAVLNGAVVGAGSLIAAGAVVRPKTVVPPGSMAVGVPAVIKPGAAPADVATRGAAIYVENARRYRTDLRRLD